MKKVALVSLALTLSMSVFAQKTTWTNGFGTSQDEKTHGIAVDISDNAYVVGEMGQGSITINSDVMDNSGNANPNGYLVKFNTAGQQEWGVFMDCNDGGSVRDVMVDGSGNIVVTGVFTDSVELNPKGSSQMAKTLAGYVAAKNFYVAKYNSSGILLWFDFMQSTGEWDSRALAIDGSDNIYVTGSGYGDLVNSAATDSAIDRTQAVESPFIAKFNSSGVFQDVVIIETAADNNGAKAYDIGIGPDGHIVVTGSTADTITVASVKHTPDLTNTLPDIFVAKYTANLAARWGAVIGGEDEDEGHSVAFDDTVNVWITGSMENSFTVASSNLTSNGGKDIIVLKLDSAGNAKGAINIGGSGTDHGNAAAVNNKTELWIAGVFTGTNVDFDPGSGTKNLNGGTADEGFIASFDLNMNLLEALSIGEQGAANDQITNSFIPGPDKLYTTGYFGSSASDFNPNGTKDTLSHVGAADAFVARYSTINCPVDDAGAITGITSACVDGQYIYSVAAVTGASTYNWVIANDPQTIISGQGTRTIVVQGTTVGSSDVEVTPGNGTCTGAKSSLTISVSAAPSFDNVVVNNSTCGNENGGFQVSMNGAGPFEYLWSNGDTLSNPNDFASGSYYLTVSNTNTSCWADTLLSIFDNGAPQVDPSSSITDVTCAKGSDGAINLVLTGGTQPYSYQWSSGDSTASATGLQAGGYRVVVQDSAGCSFDQIFIVKEPRKLGIIPVDKDVSSCGGNDGEADVTIVGGTAPFSYSWSNGDTNKKITNLTVGAYRITVSDSSGCMDSAWANVSEVGGPSLSLDSIRTVTCDSTNGGIYITGSSSGTITYMWSNGSNNEDLSGVGKGIYSVTATDAGCSSIFSMKLVITSPMKNEICILTVDDSSRKNLCAFERAQLNGIERYNFYRESWEPGKYIRMGWASNDSISLWIDETADPVLKPWRYKISAVNNCGIESDLSDYHQSMHLVVKKSDTTRADLSWTGYQGFAYNKIYIDRYTDTSDWVTIDSVDFTQTTYTDLNPPVDKTLEYALGVDHPNGCLASRANNRNLNSARSNRSIPPFTKFAGDTSTTPPDTTYVPQIENRTSFRLFPNPTEAGVYIVASNEGLYEVDLLDVNGRVVISSSFNMVKTENHFLDLEGIESGSYILRFKSASNEGPPEFVRIIKQ